jgi:poly-gamma-glutamate capsule biosynthesis protein CapA/YwtB (metallophosphatase superfamily)
MLHLGISLPCVDIVVLLDTGDKIDERIQKMYRALTESTNKKGGYIIDMNYFRTVNAIMNYQITNEKVRKHKEKIYSNDIPNLFNKVLDIYSIDIDKPIFGTHDERKTNSSEIQKTTIPELEKVFKSRKSSGDTLVLENAGTALNRNIKYI